MTLKTVKALIGAVTLALTASAALADTEIRMWTFLDIDKDNPRSQALRKIIENFESQNPGLTVKVETQQFDIMPSRFYMGHQQGKNPDVVWIDAKNLGGLADSGAGADLNELFIDDWTEAQDKDFYIRPGWEAMLIDGKRYAVPLFHGGAIVYYRKDLFAEAGIDPADVKTWDDLVAAAEQLQKDTDGDGTVDVYGLIQPLKNEKTEASPMHTSMFELTPDMFNDDCSANFANEAGVRSLLMNAAMLTESKISPQESIVQNTNDVIDLFAAGRGATTIASVLRFARTKAHTQFDANDMGVMPWPTWSGEKAGPTLVSGWWVAVWDDSEHKAEAAKFVEHMISPESVELWSLVGGQVPTRLSVFENPAFDSPDYAYLKTMRDAWAQAGHMYPPRCNTSKVQQVLNEALQAVVLGGEDPMEALQDAERKHMDVQ